MPVPIILYDAVLRVLNNADVPLSTPRIAKRVIETGYSTQAENFTAVVHKKLCQLEQTQQIRRMPRSKHPVFWERHAE